MSLSIFVRTLSLTGEKKQEGETEKFNTEDETHTELCVALDLKS